MDLEFDAKYIVKKNIFNKLPSDTINFKVYNHYGRPHFEKHEFVILYISKSVKDSSYYHQKYQYDIVKKSEKGKWEGLNGEPIEELFLKKKNGILKHRKVFD